MIEDKLTHDERLRLECLAQAVAAEHVMRGGSQGIVARAAQFEEFVKGGK